MRQGRYTCWALHDFVIEVATFRDAQTIARASRDLIEHGLGWRWNMTAVARALHQANVEVIVAKRGRQVLGFAVLELGDTKAHLLLLAVMPLYRRQGVGSALMRWLDTLCTTAGLFEIRLEVRAQNTGAIDFYRRLDFTIERRRVGYYQGREDAFVMSRSTVAATSRRNKF